MKFPKVVLQNTIDEIERSIWKMDVQSNSPQSYIIHESEYGYIANVNLFIKKIAKYLDATITYIDNNVTILYRNGTLICIHYHYNDDDNRLIMKVVIAKNMSILSSFTS